jgi:O-antigen ligase
VRLTPRPALPLAVLLLLLPAGAVLQFRAAAPAATVVLALTVLLHRWAAGGWPWPRGAVPVAALALLGWLGVSALWSIEPWRAAELALRLAGFVLLGAMAARAMALTPPAALRLVAPALVLGVALGAALALGDGLSGHAVRAWVRGLDEIPWNMGFGAKPAISLLALLLPLAVFGAGLRWLLAMALAGLALAAALVVPAEGARLALLAALAAGVLALRLGPWVARGLGVGLAGAILAAPWLVGAALSWQPNLERLPLSAAHRVITWEFAAARIAERPVLGWGGEASRSLPGADALIPEAVLERHGLNAPFTRLYFRVTEGRMLQLHPHNMALQLWLELGVVGALLGASLAVAAGLALAAHGPAGAGAFAAGIVTAMTGYGVWQEWWIGLVLVAAAVLVALRRVASGTAPISEKD